MKVIELMVVAAIVIALSFSIVSCETVDKEQPKLPKGKEIFETIYEYPYKNGHLVISHRDDCMIFVPDVVSKDDAKTHR